MMGGIDIKWIKNLSGWIYLFKHCYEAGVGKATGDCLIIAPSLFVKRNILMKL